MTEWIALLRGVNVGGVTIRSAELREVFEGLGFSAVRTVLASGNVAFETGTSAAARLKREIERALSERFGYEAWIVLLTAERLRAVVEAFPFDAHDGGRQPYVVFASEPAAIDALLKAIGEPDPRVDPIERGDGVAYWNPVKGTTVDTPFAKVLAKPVFKTTTTNRNLRTLEKLLA
ncbi:DUF1697 domain-containing protein [Agromyces aurantiacus]|uniref:DUF1697 domain-containing protein n=1 Tax=Agromyces aurantiacus TaxID=165814 RepID=A0ABV9R7P6_9MICO|nr:DUF1697 domain-containing protein [Agromyces aurantiacus]MBM7504930.1 uncharacterized protein (DUF1697 family) [Agromyces aurantiacus]